MSIPRKTMTMGCIALAVGVLCLGVVYGQQRGGLAYPVSENTFTLNDLQGQYGCTFDGEVIGLGPLAAMAWIDLDGADATATRTMSLNGDILTQMGTGTNQINANGTGSATYVITTISPPGIPDAVETFDYALTNDRLEILFVATAPGVVAQGRCSKVIRNNPARI